MSGVPLNREGPMTDIMSGKSLTDVLARFLQVRDFEGDAQAADAVWSGTISRSDEYRDGYRRESARALQAIERAGYKVVPVDGCIEMDYAVADSSAITLGEDGEVHPRNLVRAIIAAAPPVTKEPAS